jgi:hypothetical protein
MKRHGRHVDPLRQKFPKGAPLKPALLKPFFARVKMELPYLLAEKVLPKQVDWVVDVVP